MSRTSLRSVDDSLILREARCGFCRGVFYLCPPCDRGQIYCSNECRVPGQRNRRRLANQRHQRTREGRRDHADRQREYRAARKKVTDQGRPPLESSGNVCAPEEKTEITLNSSLHTSVMKGLHEPALLRDPTLAGTNPPILSLREPGTASCGPAPTRSGPPARGLHSPRGSLTLVGPASLGCAVCGREGEFIRAGPLRRLRVR